MKLIEDKFFRNIYKELVKLLIMKTEDINELPNIPYDIQKELYEELKEEKNKNDIE